MIPDRRPSETDLTIRDIRRLIAAIRAWRNKQERTFQEAMQQPGNDAAGPRVVPSVRPQAGTLPEPVREAMARGQKIEAIRLLRAHTGLGLKEAKEAVEAHARATPSAMPMHDPSSALAPGQVPASGSSIWIWLVAALGIAALLAYRFWPAWSA